jgi:transposase InsO family protein
LNLLDILVEDYVAFIIDVYSRRLVGWKASRTMTAALDEDLGNSSDPLTEIPQLSAEVVCC